MNNDLKQIIETLKQFGSDIERLEWFTNNRASIIPLLAELRDEDHNHYEVVLEDIVDGFGHGNKTRLRKEIKFHVDAITKKKINERNKEHFDEEVNLSRNSKGREIPTIDNIGTIILASKHLPLRFDDFTNDMHYEVYNGHQLPWLNANNQNWFEIRYHAIHKEKETDNARYYLAKDGYQLASLKRYLGTFFPEEINWRSLPDAMIYASQQNHVNVYRDFVRNGLPEWDGKDRMDFLYRFAGVLHREWAITAALSLTLSMIARCMEPGYDVRGLVVLEGPQNSGKSRLAKAFSFHEQFFRQITLTKYNTEGYEVARQLKGMAVVEFPDMGGIGDKDHNFIKAFLSSTHDSNRKLFQDNVDKNGRYCIFIITTNNIGRYLGDPTGNTRYLPVHCTFKKIDVDAIIAEMPQIYAQALWLWDHGVSPRLEPGEELLQSKMVEKREIKPDYYFWLLDVLKLHRNEFVRDDMLKWDDGVSMEEILGWAEQETWLSKGSRHNHKTEIIASLRKHFKIDNVVRTKRFDGIAKSTKKWRYTGDVSWDEFIDSLEVE